MVFGEARAVCPVFCFPRSFSDLSLSYTYTETFLDLACLFSMAMMVQVLSIVVVVSVLLPIVELLELGPCNHLVRLLLDVIEGGGGVISSVLLSTASSSVQVACELVGILILRVRAQVLMASLDLAFCFVLAAFSTWYVTSVSTSTLFLIMLIVGANLGDFVLNFKLGFFLP
jgi:hypothetical protein